MISPWKFILPSSGQSNFQKAWPVLEGDIRRSLVNRFPYGVLYSEERDKIFIVAVMNLYREPGYWKQRK